LKLKKTNISTQSLLGVKGFSRNGIQTNGHGEIVFYMVSPTNISVLSRVAVAQKIKHLMTLLSAQPDMEIVCIDARENFDDNKLYLDERFNDEPNGRIRELLLKDKTFLDDIQVQMSTAREFLFLVRIRNESDEESFSRLNRIEKCINEQGFNCKRADKDDTKRVIARYFGVRTNDETIEDYDGDKAAEKWIIPD
jgi:hypothetical protein